MFCACSMHGRKVKCVQNSVLKIWRENHFEVLRSDDWFLRNLVVCNGDFALPQCVSGYGPVPSSCEQGNPYSNSIKGEETMSS